jgi:hypothetical protein
MSDWLSYFLLLWMCKLQDEFGLDPDFRSIHAQRRYFHENNLCTQKVPWADQKMSLAASCHVMFDVRSCIDV